MAQPMTDPGPGQGSLQPAVLPWQGLSAPAQLLRHQVINYQFDVGNKRRHGKRMQVVPSESGFSEVKSAYKAMGVRGRRQEEQFFCQSSID